METHSGSYFITFCLDSDEAEADRMSVDEIFPVWFNTMDYDKAKTLVGCITSIDPKKILMYSGSAEKIKNQRLYD